MIKSKNIWFLTLLLFVLISCSKKEYHVLDIMMGADGLYTEKFSSEPITGKVYGNYGKVNDTKKIYLGEIVNGKREGNWTLWHDNGYKLKEISFKNNLYEGVTTTWYDNGYKESERNFIAGVENGLRIEWYNTGEKKAEINFRDDLENGLKTTWYKNGQIEFECNMKNGSKDGKCPEYIFYGKIEKDPRGYKETSLIYDFSEALGIQRDTIPDSFSLIGKWQDASKVEGIGEWQSAGGIYDLKDSGNGVYYDEGNLNNHKPISYTLNESTMKLIITRQYDRNEVYKIKIETNDIIYWSGIVMKRIK